MLMHAFMCFAVDSITSSSSFSFVILLFLESSILLECVVVQPYSPLRPTIILCFSNNNKCLMWNKFIFLIQLYSASYNVDTHTIPSSRCSHCQPHTRAKEQEKKQEKMVFIFFLFFLVLRFHWMCFSFFSFMNLYFNLDFCVKHDNTLCVANVGSLLFDFVFSAALALVSRVCVCLCRHWWHW